MSILSSCLGLRGNTGLLHRFAPKVSQYSTSIPQHDDSIDRYILPRTTVFHHDLPFRLSLKINLLIKAFGIYIHLACPKGLCAEDTFLTMRNLCLELWCRFQTGKINQGRTDLKCQMLSLYRDHCSGQKCPQATLHYVA